MSHIVNRSPDSPQSSGAQPPEVSSVQSHASDPQISDSSNATNPDDLADSTGTVPLDVSDNNQFHRPVNLCSTEQSGWLGESICLLPNN
jgi:hypothetical protein